METLKDVLLWLIEAGINIMIVLTVIILCLIIGTVVGLLFGSVVYATATVVLPYLETLHHYLVR